MQKHYQQVIEEVKDVNTEERSIVHFISTENVDRQGDIVRAKGMDDTSFEKNPVVLYGHNYKSFPVGKSLWRKKSTRGERTGILAKTQFADTAEGRQVFDLWQGGYLNASSIGFMPTKVMPIESKDNGGMVTGFDIQEWELLEYSIVPVPANAEALRLALDKGLASPEFVAEMEAAVREKRLCDLEECGKEMKTKFDGLDIAKLLLKSDETDGKVSDLLSRIETLEAAKIPVPEKVVTLSEDQMKTLISQIANGAFRKLQGKLD